MNTTNTVWYTVKRSPLYGATYLTCNISGFGYTKERSAAIRQSNVNDILADIAERQVRYGIRDPERSVLGGDTLSIVRVEETPGVVRRVELGETESAPEGATVKYALKNTNGYHVQPLPAPSRHGYFSMAIEDAALFDENMLALGAMQNNAIQNGTWHSTELVRIAILPGTPTITETVLA